MFDVIVPTSAQELEQYYRFRWEVLNKPLQMPLGSERDAYDELSVHRMVRNQDGEAIAVGRLFISDADEALIRHVAVSPHLRKQGLGISLMAALESAAHSEGVRRLVVNARGDSSNFFSRCGYEMASEPEFDKAKIKYQQMVKRLDPEHYFIRQPKLCVELQNMLSQQIPISDKMGVRLEQYTGRELSVKMPLPGNTNPHQSMFAGSIYSLAVMAGWSMVWLMLREHGLQGDIVLVKGEIKYRKPVLGDALALANKSAMQGSLLPLIESKKCKMKITIELFSNHELVAQMHGMYMILPKENAE
ncbi:bifunctional GNAT family N-acetyltransferase/hotdog fold thioesterase [Alginatibacterium sediminis]|nr:YiiD C-terminal domain-containing protein [Alginatibacterium sediminis]